MSPTYKEGDLRLGYTEGSAEHNILLTDALSWFNTVFAYLDHGSGPHTVTSSLFQIPVK